MNSKDRVIVYGNIVFDVEDKTNKHKLQSSWKKTAFVFIEGDICEYYSRFIKKRYRVIINKPLRGGHISFINDSMKDLTHDGEISEEEVERLWEDVKTKWGGVEIPIILDLNPRTNDEHWWLNVPHEERELLQKIRYELGLSKPFFGLHMSIGYCNEKNIEHSRYIHDCIKKGFI